MLVENDVLNCLQEATQAAVLSYHHHPRQRVKAVLFLSLLPSHSPTQAAGYHKFRLLQAVCHEGPQDKPVHRVAIVPRDYRQLVLDASLQFMPGTSPAAARSKVFSGLQALLHQACPRLAQIHPSVW